MLRLAFVLSFIVILPVARAGDPLTIEKHAPCIEYRRFDPAKLPDPPPPLQADERALCEYTYYCDSTINYQPTVRPGAPEVDVRVTGVTVKLRLTITIWLPNDAPPLLVAHEQGHRAIAEHYYKEAEAIARKAAAPALAARFKLPAKGWEAAASKRVDAMANTLYNTYLDAVNVPCGKAQAAYDDLTDHARRKNITAEQAVAKALETK